MMGWITAAQRALDEMDAAEPLRQRVFLALEEAAQLETHLEECRAAKAVLEAKLQDTRAHAHQQQEELQTLQTLHAEEVRILSGIEFRRGRRTGGDWIAFCPKCHLPAVVSGPIIHCCDRSCQWGVEGSLHQLARALP
jgi:hypothetical protein